MTPKMPDEHGDFRRKQITAAAWECFTEKGYRETTVRDIARRMNTSTGVIYRYFSGKDEILEAVSRRAQESTFRILERAAGAVTTREGLAELFRILAEETSRIDRQQEARGAITLWAEALKRKQYWKICTSQQGPVLDRLTQMIDRGIANDDFRIPVDPRSFAGFVLALIMGLQVQSILFPGMDTSAYYDDIKKILLRNVWQDEGDGS